jgi:hypothetical protein
MVGVDDDEVCSSSRSSSVELDTHVIALCAVTASVLFLNLHAVNAQARCQCSLQKRASCVFDSRTYLTLQITRSSSSSSSSSSRAGGEPRSSRLVACRQHLSICSATNRCIIILCVAAPCARPATSLP